MAPGLIHPGRHPGRAFTLRPRPRAYARPPEPTPRPPAIGPVGAATFVLSLQPGTKTSFSWQTSIFSSYSGAEQRESTVGPPRRRFEGTAFLLDGGMRDLAGVLQRAAAQGSAFALALPFEALTITADSTGSVVTVGSTALCDWLLVGQRCVIVGRAGSVVNALVAASTATTITVALVDAAGAFTSQRLGPIGLAGGRIMPLVQVVLDPTQGFSRYPVSVGLWSLRATAVAFGFGGVDSMGRGALITTMTDGVPVPVEELAEDDVVIWDRVNAVDGTAGETMIARTELVDMGGVPFAIGGAEHPDWGRVLKLRSSSLADWQWLKAMTHRLRGKQGAFLLSTNRADLVFDSAVPGGFKVKSAAVPGGGDFVSFFASQSHRRLAVTAGGVVQYTTVTAVTDNGDGTVTVLVDNIVEGLITRISFLEQVRIDSDDIEPTWDGGTFSFESSVVTVHEVVQVPQRFLFDVVLDTGILTIPVVELTGTFGLNTLIQFKANGTKTGSGIAAAGGNIDGMVVCVVVDDSTGGAIFLQSENTSSSPENRLRLAGGGLTIGAGACWFRYSGSVQRWLELMRST